MQKVKLSMIPVEEYPEPIKTKRSGIKYVAIARVTKERELGEEILTVTFFSTKNKKPEFRVFANRRDFITDKIQEEKWSTCMLDSLLDWGWQRQSIMMADDDSETCGGEFFKNGASDTLSALEDFQKEVRLNKNNKRHDQIKMQTSAVMAQIKKLPKDIDKWINEVPLLSSRYIYYKRDKKKVNGRCTVCNSDVQVLEAKHNLRGQCPRCKSKIMFKAIGKSKHVSDDSSMAIIEKGEGKLEGAIIVRCFTIYRNYSDHYKNPETRYYEEARYVIKNKTIFMFEWKSAYRPSGWEAPSWHRLKNNRIIRSYFLYTKGLESLLVDTPWKYSAIGAYATHAGLFNVLAYLDRYLEYPSIEYLTKLSLFNLVNESLTRYGVSSNEVKLNGKNIIEILGVGKGDITFLQKVNIKGSELKEYREAKKEGQTFTEHILNWVRKYGTNYGCLEEVTKHTSFERAINYLEKQYHADEHMSNIIRTWRDYLNGCETLEMNFEDDRVLFPKELHKSHQEMIARIESEADALMDCKISERLPLLEKYCFEHNGLMIRPASSTKELIREGKALKHCVGDYNQRYMTKYSKGQIVLLLIRNIENPDMPFATMEIEKDVVIQVQGYDNKFKSKYLDEFVKVFKAKILTKKKVRSQNKISIPA